jgi:hypothetical protein
MISHIMTQSVFGYGLQVGLLVTRNYTSNDSEQLSAAVSGCNTALYGDFKYVVSKQTVVQTPLTL